MVWESIIIALDGLKMNKLRSALTMLGIIIGVGAVIALVSLGLGTQQQVEDDFASLGSNNISIIPGAAVAPGSVRSAAGTIVTLTGQDAKAIASQVPGIARVAPEVVGSYQVVYGNQNWNTMVQGTTADFFAVQNYSLASGFFFTDEDDEVRAKVAVIGPTVADNLFDRESPVGQTIRIGTAPFRVIGVLERKGESLLGNQDDVVIVPLSTYQDRLSGQTYVNKISVQVEDLRLVEQTGEFITMLLRARHRLANGEKDDFRVANYAALLEKVRERSRSLTLFLGCIAAISLLVGGIGIMNIMLVSVTERTREIGIRKALGATYKNILLQFLIEATVVSVTGGLIGILLGIFAAQGLGKVLVFPTVVSQGIIGVAFGISVIIGLFFGIYPARKAARLNPIDALRYE